MKKIIYYTKLLIPILIIIYLVYKHSSIMTLFTGVLIGIFISLFFTKTKLISKNNLIYLQKVSDNEELYKNINKNFTIKEINEFKENLLNINISTILNSINIEFYNYLFIIKNIKKIYKELLSTILILDINELFLINDIDIRNNNIEFELLKKNIVESSIYIENLSKILKLLKYNHKVLIDDIEMFLQNESIQIKKINEKINFLLKKFNNKSDQEINLDFNNIIQMTKIYLKNFFNNLDNKNNKIKLYFNDLNLNRQINGLKLDIDLNFYKINSNKLIKSLNFSIKSIFSIINKKNDIIFYIDKMNSLTKNFYIIFQNIKLIMSENNNDFNFYNYIYSEINIINNFNNINLKLIEENNSIDIYISAFFSNLKVINKYIILNNEIINKDFICLNFKFDLYSYIEKSNIHFKNKIDFDVQNKSITSELKEYYKLYNFEFIINKYIFIYLSEISNNEFYKVFLTEKND